MDFFTRFKDLYNYTKSLEAIEITIDDWKNFNQKILDFSKDQLDHLYEIILHYNYLENKKLELFPYGLKRHKESEGIVFEPKKLPLHLQYIMLNFY